MKIPTNYKKAVDDSITINKWTLLATRTKSPPLPVLYKFYPLASELGRTLYGVSVPTVTVWERGVGRFYVESKAYKKSISGVTRLLCNSARAKVHIERALNWCRRTIAAARFFHTKDFSKYSNKFLLREYKKVTKLYAETFTRGYVTWCVHVLQKEALQAVAHCEKELAAHGLTVESALGRIIISRRRSLYTKKEEALKTLARKLKSVVGEADREARYLKERHPRAHNAILRFLGRYGWVGYDYEGPVMSYDEVLQIVRDRTVEEEKNTVLKSNIMRACRFSAEQRELFDVLSLISLIKDERNACDDYVHYCLDNFYAEVGRRLTLSRNEVRYLWPEEFEEAFSGAHFYCPLFSGEIKVLLFSDTR